ncbi:flagellar export protein FliJ [Krasilnikovia sp. MM14-A1259]|uniref:flagellar export protein FliJ n=1 Tax=Krasilnikovia sp. MM14-A1259 TaxID=3373539 RepID=UPI003818EE95
MNRFFRLAPVLRARKAQEDAARGAVLQSQAEIRQAQALVKRRHLELTGSDAPTEGTARAMVASLVARQSLAASLFDAHRMVTDAEEANREKMADLADAAKRRRAVEMLSERHAEAVRKHDLATDQQNLDELAITAKARNAARGLDGLREERANPMRHGRGTAADREAASRAAANAVAAQRPTIDLADPALTLAAQRAALVSAQQRTEPADIENDSTDDENRSRA